MPSSGTAVCTCACVCVFRSPTLERDLSASLSELPLSSINLSLSFCHLSLSLYPLFPPLNSRQLFLSLFTSSLLRSCSLFSHFVDFFINLRRLHFLYINTVTIDLIYINTSLLIVLTCLLPSRIYLGHVRLGFTLKTKVTQISPYVTNYDTN